MKKQEFKKSEESYKPLGQPETFQYLNYRGARRRRTIAKIENLFEQIMKENFLNLAK